MVNLSSYNLGQGVRTNLIQLDNIGVCVQLVQELLCGIAVRAVGLGEDGCNSVALARLPFFLRDKLTDAILINNLLGLCLGSRHVCRADCRRREESA